MLRQSMCTEISGYRLLRDLNKIKLVLSTFKDSLFALNQVESKSNSLLTICSSTSMDLLQ